MPGDCIAAFSAPYGYVSDNTDCDDNDPARFPNNNEICDGKDNDCDNILPADEIDNDGDGMWECQGDCDDTDPNTYAGAPEICDGKDNDCDGVIDEIDYTYYYPLAEGWNLISYQVKVCVYDDVFPATDPNLFIIDPNEVEFINLESLKDWLLDDATSPIRDSADPNKAGDWQRITSFDHNGAHLLDKDLPESVNTLHYFSLGYGYWIKMNKDGYLVIQGQPATSDISLNLKDGWNLMGFIPPDICYAKDPNAQANICPYQTGAYQQEEGITFCPVDPFPQTVLAGINGKYQRITSFDRCDGAMLFDKDLPDFVNTLDYIGPKYAYWIKMLGDGQMVFPDGCP